MPYNIRIVSTYPPRRCGIGTFSRSLADALSNFAGEVGSIRIAAIDNDRSAYKVPVDIVIDQRDPGSWRAAVEEIAWRAGAGNMPTAVILQHEYGLDTDLRGNDGRGRNYVETAQALREKDLTTLVYLHTVLDDPNAQQRKTLLDLAEYSDGLIVTTESAIDILESDTYGIEHSKLKHLDHGIRMQHPSQFDRLALKRGLGLENHFLAVTLGMLSPDKGVQYGIRAYGRFVNESCTSAQRRQMVYLIAGQCHPDFVNAAGDSHYAEFQKVLGEALEEAKVKWCKVGDLASVDFDKHDVVFWDAFLTESDWLKLYGALNVMVLPYLNTQQISSGILADTLGAGRVAIATKFRYAVELIHSGRSCPEGTFVGRFARGVLVDPGEGSVEQIAQGLDYVVFKENKRLMMEKQAHQRGYQMRWDNSAWGLLQYIDFVREEKEIVTGRGIKFTRDKASPLEIKTGRSI